MHSEPASHEASNSADAILCARVRFLFDGMPLSMSGTVLLSFITTLILAQVQHSPLLYMWFAMILTITFVRTLQYRAFRRAQRSGNVDWTSWRRRFLVGCTSVGVLWGLACFVLFPHDITYQVFLSFVVAGTSAGAVITLSADRTVTLGFVLPSAVPLAGMLAVQGSSVTLAMSIMVVMYLLVVIAATHRLHLRVIESVRADLEAAAQRAALARSEHERRVSDEKLHTLFEHSPLGIALLNDRNAILEANPALLNLLGWDLREIRNRTLALGFEGLTPAPRAQDALAATSLLGPMEYEIPRADGSMVPVAVNGMQIEHPSGEIYRWAFIEAIGQRKAAEMQLRTLNDRLMLAARAAEFGIWEFDSQQGKLTWDAKMYEIFGMDLIDEPDLSRAWRSRLHPDDAARANAQIDAAISRERGFADEYRLVLPNGEEKTIRAAAMTRHNSDDGSYRLTGVAWDVTALRRVDRLKSEFVATVSHELRTPLTSIRAALSLVTHGVAGELTAQVHQLLAIADRHAERLALLIDDLLDIEKIEAGKLKFELTEQPLRPLLELAIATNAPYAKLRSVRFELLPGGDGLLVRADTNRLLQVLANLLSNAAKFSPGQSTVIVALTTRDGRARVEVRDQGPGIGPELRQRLFTKFTQGDGSDTRRNGGTGLGLAISKALVERMGGSINFDSTPGCGATFYFELPLQHGAEHGVA